MMDPPSSSSSSYSSTPSSSFSWSSSAEETKSKSDSKGTVRGTSRTRSQMRVRGHEKLSRDICERHSMKCQNNDILLRSGFSSPSSLYHLSSLSLSLSLSFYLIFLSWFPSFFLLLFTREEKPSIEHVVRACGPIAFIKAQCHRTRYLRLPCTRTYSLEVSATSIENRSRRVSPHRVS